MTDLTPTIQAKSDQLNADDLMAGPITVTIEAVTDGTGKDQPISVRYTGDNKRPWKPCKSMRRVLVHVWGPDGEQYIGKSLTLFRDPNVRWGAEEVGGVRISHMSHIDKPMIMPLTVTRGRKEAYQIQPLQVAQQAAPAPKDPQYNGSPISDGDYDGWTTRMDEALTMDEINAIGRQIGEVAPNYDQASVDRLKAYFRDRLNQIKGGQ